jgi:outer membrane protein assembly factor BamA
VPLRETLTAINVGTPYVHAIFGGFEQGSGVGGGVQLTSARAIPAVEFRAAVLGTTRKDRRYDVEAFLPSIGGSRNHADIWFTQLHRRTDFYGIGPDASQDLKTEFGVDRRSYQGSLYRDLTAHLQGGVYAQVLDTRGVLHAESTSSQILSYGTFLSYDTRDNSSGLTRGLNLFGRVASADSVGRRNGAAKYGWNEAEIDARAHAPLGSSRTALLLRTRAQFKAPTAGGNTIPYYDLSWLGGRQYLRGYHSYRFRDNNVLLFSSELQQTIIPLTNTRGVDVFASADAGQVWGPERFNTRNWESGFGGGLQYRHSRSIAARIEAGRSRERVAFYASLSRGF